MRSAILATLLMLAIPTSAMADDVGPVAEPPPPGHRLAQRGYVCEQIKGDAALETAATETPPPSGPNGEKLTRQSAPSACPAGMLGVTTALTGARKTRRASMPDESPEVGLASPLLPPTTSAEEGYYYVGDIWEKAKIGDMNYKSQLSAPVVPATAAKGAHSISQLALVGGGKGQYSIETGWIKELKDQEEGFKSPRPFFFVNPDAYGELSCYDCGLILAEGVTENPYEQHYKPTDGSPESECHKGTEVIKPCSLAVGFTVKQYKGAWWLWYGTQWVGRVSDEAWGKHFTTGKEEQVYGEVFDTPNNPTTPMGNGNKGGCTCATEAYAPALGFKATAKEPEPILSQETFHNPIMNVSWPQRYTAGNFNEGRTTYHFGG
jgi:Neprosin